MTKRYETTVAVEHRESYQYPSADHAFRPSKAYPEYLFPADISPERNEAYDMVRSAFALAGYDAEHFDTPQWNPLGHLIQPGNCVLIKPNLVMDTNPSGDGCECLYTQPGVIAAVVDYALLALGGSSGRIVIGDAPMQECQFQKLVRQSGLDKLLAFYRGKGVNIELVDFRELTSVVKGHVHQYRISKNAHGTVVDLKNDSAFQGLSQDAFDRMRVTNYDPRLLVTHHQPGKNEYYVSDCVLNADVIINMPKPKSHRKAGVTIALKNLVGINVRKEYLPHHTVGSKESGRGDEYLRTSALKELQARERDRVNINAAEKRYHLARILHYSAALLSRMEKLLFSDGYSEGSWYGNDTISKTIVDLNKIVFYADRDGVLQETPQRGCLIVADMLQSGEREGPVMPSRKDVGVIAVGENPVLFDECLAALMGADVPQLPTLTCARQAAGRYPLAAPDQCGIIRSNDPRWDRRRWNEVSAEESLLFYPTSGWLSAFYQTKEEARDNRRQKEPAGRK